MFKGDEWMFLFWHSKVPAFLAQRHLVYFPHTLSFCLFHRHLLFREGDGFKLCLSRPLDTTGQLSSVQTDALYFCLELRVMEDIKEEEKHRDGGGKLLYTVFVD